MTDIVERAAQVACPNGPDHDHIPNLDQTCHWALQLCQALADAGLLVRTVPTREEVADVIYPEIRSGEVRASEMGRALNAADAVLALWEKVLEGSEDLDQPVTIHDINRASGAKFAEPIRDVYEVAAERADKPSAGTVDAREVLGLPTRAQLMESVAPVLFNVLNYPRAGESVVPLAGKIADAVLALLAGDQK